MNLHEDMTSTSARTKYRTKPNQNLLPAIQRIRHARSSRNRPNPDPYSIYIHPFKITLNQYLLIHIRMKVRCSSLRWVIYEKSTLFSNIKKKSIFYQSFIIRISTICQHNRTSSKYKQYVNEKQKNVTVSSIGKA